ncbi:MAG: UDP-glucose 4-epimerase GalE [Bacteroidetes bacterium]|nr:MAG: UDP-glucose 4-epimerase GalE [Bacteroidota bacterium]
MNRTESILVTGGAGYIGSHTAVSLEKAGFRVILLDNLCNSDISAIEGIRSLVDYDVPFYQVDCRDKESLGDVFQSELENGTPITGVIHFAALKAVGESVEKPDLYKDNNIGGTRVLLEVMKEKGVSKLVFSSSCTVYGEPENVPVNESSPILPAVSPYGFTKQECERLIQDHTKRVTKQTFQSVLLRYFNPIGAHPSSVIGESPKGVPNNLVPYICKSAAGLSKPLIVFGTDYPTPDGSCVRDYLHIMDLAEAHVSAINFLFDKSQINRPFCRAFNLGTGVGTSVLEVIKAFEKVNGVSVPHVLGGRRSGDVVSIWSESLRAKSELGWYTKRSLEESLKDAWNWQKKFI